MQLLKKLKSATALTRNYDAQAALLERLVNGNPAQEEVVARAVNGPVANDNSDAADTR